MCVMTIAIGVSDFVSKYERGIAIHMGGNVNDKNGSF